MKKLLPYLRIYIFWLAFFVAAKIIFLIYFNSLSQTLTGTEIAQIFIYGFKMDASFAAYICILPFLLFFISVFAPALPTKKVIRIYNFVLIILISLLLVVDLGLYKAWGFRMDDTPLVYLKTPKELFATASSAPVFLLTIIFILNIALFLWLYHFLVDVHSHKVFQKINLGNIFLSLLMIVILFVPIRGGFQKIPLNISDVYFSEKIFADHAAINLPWNIMFSILNRNDVQNPYDYFPEEKARDIVQNVYQIKKDSSISILNQQRPNLVFIILESFTAKWISVLGGEVGVTPQLNKIANEGLLFTNIYATGDRSEKGIIGILSGYPNQAITSIIKTPNKTRNLQSLNEVLKKNRYTSSFYYGGELEFANIKSYLINTGFDQLVDKYSFPLSQRTTSWGVHDEYLFPRFAEHLNSVKPPSFSVLFTLSSHEPYDVPLLHFKEKDEVSRFKNSIYYTDSLLGKFIEQGKASAWWKNSLVVIVADHGHPYPGYDANDAPSKFHIPLIFTGGALTQHGRIDAVGSQSDLINTLLNQMKINDSSFQWGKDLLNPFAPQFAFYSFNNGFGWITDEGYATFDNFSRKIIQSSKNFDSSWLVNGKAYMQYSYEDFLKR